MKIIAFGHRRRTGKDSCCKFLCSHLRLNRKGSNIQRVGFADKLKDIAHDLYGWAGLKHKEYYEEHQHAKETILPAIGKSPREVYINLGTLVGRTIYKETWIDYLFNNMLYCNILLISDLRFIEEVHRVKSLGGYIIKVERPGIEQSLDIADNSLECFNGWDHVISNDSDLKSLNDKAISLIERFEL